MGQNLQRWLEVILESPDWTNVKIARDLHPHHSNATIQKLKDNNLVVFPQGNGVIHYLFGCQVVQREKEGHYHQPQKSNKGKTATSVTIELPGKISSLSSGKTAASRLMKYPSRQ
jgi:hypothetical protein